MKRMHAHRRTIRPILLAAGLWAGAAQAEEAASPGITDTSIKIGVTGALTGPVAALGAVVEGIRVKVEAVNAAGGVAMGDGKTRAIELVIEDDGLDPQRTLSNVRKLVERDEVFALVGHRGHAEQRSDRALYPPARGPEPLHVFRRPRTEERAGLGDRPRAVLHDRGRGLRRVPQAERRRRPRSPFCI